MKKIIYLLTGVFILFAACKVEKKEKNDDKNIKFVSFGDKISTDNTISQVEMAKKFDNLQLGDTISVKFSSEVDEVCQKKGCWIKVPLKDGKQSFVRFKDYAFFMPFNAAGSDVILRGKAFKNEISVKQLQHYAKDAGKSGEEIAEITTPKVTYSFLADGVLLEAKANEK